MNCCGNRLCKTHRINYDSPTGNAGIGGERFFYKNGMGALQAFLLQSPFANTRSGEKIVEIDYVTGMRKVLFHS